MMISRSAENSSRLSIRLPFMATNLLAAEGFSACPPASPILSPDAADMFSLRSPKIQIIVCLYKAGEAHPTATTYNRCKLRRPIVDRSDTATYQSCRMPATARIRKFDSQQAARLLAAHASQLKKKIIGWGYDGWRGWVFARPDFGRLGVFNCGIGVGCRFCADGGCASCAPVAGTAETGQA